MHQTKSYPNEQMSLYIIDTFKGQDNKEEAKICGESNCVLVIVIHSLYITYILPLDITFNKPEKSFIKKKYGILNRLLNNLIKAKTQQMLKFP